jgi:CRISPR-associated endonuclease Csn1
MKKILGLDLGTNSIGWALVEIDHNKGIVRIIGMGSRILPMNATEINDFESKGKIKSSAALRTEKRGIRRLNERYLLRRDRLHLVLNLLDSLPEHYKLDINFTNSSNKKCGQFKSFKEPKLAYDTGKNEKGNFLFKDSYQEMLDEIGIENQKGKRIPYDWTLYYLRQKALSEKISLEELAWVLLSYNQKRGYEKIEVEDKSTKDNEIIEELDLHATHVERKIDNNGSTYYDITLDGAISFKYKEYTETQLTFVDDIKEVIKTSKVDTEGNIKDKEVEFTVVDIFNLQIADVKYQKEDGKHNFSIIYDNGWIEVKPPTKNFTNKYFSAKGKSYDYIVETKYTHLGEIKKTQGKERKFREPDFSDNSSDWTLLKKKTEKEALAFNYRKTGEAQKFISPKIYSVLKQDAQTGKRTKIIGGMFQVIDREFYRQELKQIINTQRRFHDTLRDKDIFEKCVRMLYPNNDSHAKSLLNNKEAIQHLLVEDILLYQRPLKSKKSEISNCKYEIRYWKETVDKSSGEIHYIPMYRKVASASHPLFQEYRIWDKIHSLKLIQLEQKDKDTGTIATNVDITNEYFNEEIYQELYEEFNKRKSINQNQFLNFCKKKFKIDYKSKNSNYVWNFPEDEELKGNQTRVSFVTRFKRCGFVDYENFLTKEKEVDLWHYLYSVNYKERIANDNKSIKTFFNGYFEGWDINEEVKNNIIKDFANYPKFSSQYCAFSEKSLKKFIPYLRMGSCIKTDYWANEDWFVQWKEQQEARKREILDKVKKIDFSSENINYDDVIEIAPKNNKLPFPKGLFNAFRDFSNITDFRKLNVSQASYLIYGRHSELAQAKHWNSPEDIRNELHKELKQHSMNNPVAEKVLLEMMQMVADIWEYHGDSKEHYFSEIHVEVGRELKKSAKEKDRDTKNQKNNREQNKRLRQVLEEFLCCEPYNANPKNKDHFERLKIIEDSALNLHQYKKKAERDEIDKILKNEITKETFEKYKLWIEQGCISPYTNKPIAMSDLFDGKKYNIDHIFPQASVTNNSLSNKVVCELEVNKEKSNKTGREFINNPGRREIYCSAHNEKVRVVSDEEYVATVLKQFSGSKKHILLSREIPKSFTNSQLNNARHISRKAMELLSHIVREEGELEFCSKNVLPVTGRITTDLKKAWQLNEVWTELVSPRFIRMNELTKSNLFGQIQLAKNGKEFFNCNVNKIIREEDESYDIKRIDHRHHALDALIVALCTREHVNYMNNINSKIHLKDIGKQKQLEAYRLTMKKNIKYSSPNKENPKDIDWYFMRPGEKRKPDANDSKENTVLKKDYYYGEIEYHGNWKTMVLDALQNTIVTFKQNLRVINTTVNRYKKDSTNNKSKQNTDNKQKYNWAIRRSLGKDTFYGKKTIEGSEKIVVRKKLDSSI